MGFEDKLKILGAKIVYYRTLRRQNQKNFADSLGISRQYLSKIENGEVPCSLIMLNRIADALGVKLFELLDGI